MKSCLCKFVIRHLRVFPEVESASNAVELSVFLAAWRPLHRSLVGFMLGRHFHGLHTVASEASLVRGQSKIVLSPKESMCIKSGISMRQKLGLPAWQSLLVDSRFDVTA